MAGGNAAGRFSDIDSGFEVMANGQQFFDGIYHANFVPASFQQARHDGDR